MIKKTLSISLRLEVVKQINKEDTNEHMIDK